MSEIIEIEKNKIPADCIEMIKKDHQECPHEDFLNEGWFYIYNLNVNTTLVIKLGIEFDGSSPIYKTGDLKLRFCHRLQKWKYSLKK